MRRAAIRGAGNWYGSRAMKICCSNSASAIAKRQVGDAVVKGEGFQVDESCRTDGPVGKFVRDRSVSSPR